MDSFSLLERFTNRAFYSEHFMDPAVWEPFVRLVCERHGFACDQVTPGLPGSFPTFFASPSDAGNPTSARSVVVKFFGPLFEGVNSHEIERILGQWLRQQSLPIPSPIILAEGQIEADWYYLIFEQVQGTSIGQVRQQLTDGDWKSVAQQMGEYMRCLHALNMDVLPNPPGAIQPSWEGYARFLRKQWLSCEANHRVWNDLPQCLLEQLKGFVLPVEQLVDFSARAHLIHADLTADHLLGRMIKCSWQTLAIIDWGDAMTGNLLYELIALHLDLFQADKRLLHICLDAYDLPAFYRQDFPRKALSMLLLHQFPMPKRVLEPYLDAATLQELAERLFAL